jgi:hypothetical protein
MTYVCQSRHYTDTMFVIIMHSNSTNHNVSKFIFPQYLEADYSILVDILEPQICVKSKDEIARSLVHILQKRSKATEFLSDIVMAEVDKLGKFAKL